MLGGYLPGDAVNINWEMQGGKHLATSMSPEFTSGVTGKISAIDAGAHTVKLENGQTTYTFMNSNGKVGLDGFRVGDMVTIVTGKEGDLIVGRAISAHEPNDLAGKIRSVDQFNKSVTMDDGQVYTFEANSKVDLGGFKAGNMVKIEAIRVGNNLVAQSISSSE